MKARLFIILVFLLSITHAYGQATDNMIYVKQFPGVTVGAKVSNAMLSCNADTNVPCILVIDPSLATASPGVLPALCAQCVLQDYRSLGWIPVGGGAIKGPITVGQINQVIHVSPNASGDFAAPINSAISACSGTVGCSVQVETAGTSGTLSGPIVINKSNVSVECLSSNPMKTSYAASTINALGYYPGPIDVQAVSNVTVRGCSVDVSSVAGLVSIHVWGSSNVNIIDNRLYSSVTPGINTSLGIRAEGSPVNIARDITVSGNFVTVPYIAFSTGDNARNVSFVGNHSTSSFQCFDFNGGGGGSLSDSFAISFTANTCTSDTASSYIESARDVTVMGNTFLTDSTTAKGATIEAHNIMSTDYHLRPVIAGNVFIGSSSQSYAAHFWQNIQNWIFSNNVVSGYASGGVLIDSAAGSLQNGVISGNQFFGNGDAGITISSTNSGVGNLAIQGNVYTGQAHAIKETGGVQPFIINQVGDVGAPDSFADTCLSCMLPGFSGTKTVGSCVLTMQGGIITGITGC